MGLIELSPNNFAAPRTRPPGMRKDVPYQPMLEARNPFVDWVTVTGIKAWYGTPLYTWPPHILDFLRRGQRPPLQGKPGDPTPDAPGAWKVAVVGDMGEASPAQTRTADEILKWGPTHVATLGDNVYPLGREVDWRKRFDPQFAKLRANTTWMPALGNHDYYAGDLTPYFDRFPQLDGHAYYSWSVGPAQFFVLDSEQRLDGASTQQAWLAAELAKSTAPYKVVQMHRPMASARAGAVGRNMYGSLGPLLAKHGVQLVLAGHVHGYERSKVLEGTTHIVSGGGGAATYAYPGAQPPDNAVRTARNHHLELSFDHERMVVRAVDDRGVAFDTTTILPSAKAQPAPAAAEDAAVGAMSLRPVPAAA